jgi:hypothetical protein
MAESGGVDDDALDGVVKIICNQRRNAIVTVASAESSASSGLTDCFNIRWGYRAKALGESRKVERGGQTMQVLAQ